MTRLPPFPPTPACSHAYHACSHPCSALLPWQHFWMEPWYTAPMRWSVCAKEVCFKNEFLRWVLGASLRRHQAPGP